MFIPNAEKVEIDLRKLTDYCSNPEHEIGKHKAIVFESALNLNYNNVEELKKALLFAVKINEAEAGKFDKFGQRYTVNFLMKRGDKEATLRSSWIIKTDSNFPSLTTCFVL